MGFLFTSRPEPLPPPPRQHRWRQPRRLVLASMLAFSLLPLTVVHAQTTGGGGRTVTVRSGDTLEGISQRTGVSVAELKR